jgi:hypothetical protein
LAVFNAGTREPLDAVAVIPTHAPGLAALWQRVPRELAESWRGWRLGGRWEEKRHRCRIFDAQSLHTNPGTRRGSAI